jgi:hypothetical protein
MKTPLVVNENGNLLFFASSDDAERYLEPIDVRNGEYVAYDAEGRVLFLRVETERVPGLFGLGSVAVERVRVEEAADTTPRPAELRAALLGYLSDKAPAGAERLPLAELVALAVAAGGLD